MPSVQDYAAYSARQSEVQRRFGGMKYGCQSAASYDLRLAPSILSLIVRGKLLDEPNLKRLEEWLDENESEWTVRRRMAATG